MTKPKIYYPMKARGCGSCDLGHGWSKSQSKSSGGGEKEEVYTISDDRGDGSKRDGGIICQPERVDTRGSGGGNGSGTIVTCGGISDNVGVGITVFEGDGSVGKNGC